MSETRTLAGHELREIPIAKTLILGILTLSIYYWIIVYRNTEDIQKARDQPFEFWVLLFWLGVFISPVYIVNFIFNGIGLNELRAKAGRPEDQTWIAALVLSLFIPIVGQIVWAVHFNNTLRA